LSESSMTIVFLLIARSTAALRAPRVAFSCTVADRRGGAGGGGGNDACKAARCVLVMMECVAGSVCV
jgi:hypothetical protein